MSNFKLLFSDYFEIDDSVLENYGALNICLSSDLPMFIDPFLLFASEKDEYKKLHKEVVNHLLILKEYATENGGKNVDINLFRFPEIKQNWLGLSEYGNGGKGLGKRFANGAITAFNGFYNTFGQEEITAETHIEKITLLNSGVGKDFISDFTTNLIFEYLLEFTENFAKEYLKENQLKSFSVRCRFDKQLKIWQPKTFKLPYLYREGNGDFIILTPLDILTVDDSVINNSDFYSNFNNVTRSLENSSLRSAVNDFFRSNLPTKPTKKDREIAFLNTIRKFPDLVDFYIKLKEDKKHEVSSASISKINELRERLVDALTPLCELLDKKSDFYKISSNSYNEALQRALYLKDVIENNDGYRIFYDGIRPIAKEDTIQRIFKLTWYASPFDVNAEVNNGRGPADYKVSFGSGDSTIVEFKLGKSSSLKKNLQNQTDIYKVASKSAKDISVVLCYSISEIRKVQKVLKEIEKENHENIIF
ncbi:hypothetical protein FPG87_02825 [Flavobacterium psychrophilum]|uniref:hypothetical protein n=1 Tax=Flavobacterium psychrophilum TaxID=96345 RepID=UPI0009042A15|nr:hypothetical protein [Flavobacterium psychrophilum]OJH12869.1 hypothetical protein FPG87_02825 [Flavobacterium psychrophilum]